MPKVKPISLDGSTLEGGGQLTRVALSLAAITNTPIHIHSIRANRGSGPRRTEQTSSRKTSSKPSSGRDKSRQHHNGNAKLEGGLKESHLAALQWLAAHCNAHVEGAEVGSREITFIPGADIGINSRSSTNQSRRQHHAARQTDLLDLASNTITLQNPGSVWLIFQALYPFMVFGNKNDNKNGVDPSSPAQPQSTTITLHGGTNVSKSMSADYVSQVFLPICQRIGLPETSISLVRRGWAGNAPQIGEVQITVHRPSSPSPSPPPSFSLPSFTLTSRDAALSSIDITVLANPASTRTQLISHLRACIASDFGADVLINIAVDEDSEDPRRLYVLLVARTGDGWRLGRDFLGSGRTPKTAAELGRMLETAARTVARELAREVKRGGAVDESCQDQLVVFQALAEGRSLVDGGGGGGGSGARKDTWMSKMDVLESDEECGDEQGSLHTRTVRWVCEEILTGSGKGSGKGVRFKTGGECFGVGWNAAAEKGDGEVLLQEKMKMVEIEDDSDDGI